jgi:ubiquinone/menaquinone biosynthesis C-methylase UbiE
MKRYALLLLCLSACHAQQTHPVTGREIAGVMAASGADWLERPEREAEEHPREAVGAMQIAKGATVADVGAGSGYISRLLAAAVGPNGTVWCSDIQPRMLEILEQKMKAAGITNYKAVLGSDTDPRLPDGQFDLILLADVYHEFAHPREMLRHLRLALRPGGRLVLLEYRKEDPNVPIREEHKMAVTTVRRELEPEGFKFEQAIETLPRQHLLIFGRRD